MACTRAAEGGGVVKYGLAWLVGIPIPLIAIWFIASQMGCG